MNTSDKPIKTSFLKKALIILIYIMMVSGVYFASLRFGISSKLSLIVAIVFGLLTLTLLIIGIILNKKNKLRGYVKIVVLIIAGFLILTNIFFLKSTYFIPHRTTSIYNRFYPESLRYSYMLETYTDGKVLVMDKSNDYFKKDYDYYTAIDQSDLTSIYSSINSTEILSENFGKLDKNQIDYLLSEKGQYLLLENNYDRRQTAYFYTGIKYSEFEKAVFLQDELDNAYFVPYEIFLDLKDIG